MFWKTSINGILVLAIALAASIFFTIPAAAQDEDYTNYGRIRHVENGVTLVRSSDNLTEEGTVNAPIFPGDTLSTERNQRVEVQLADYSFVRLDYSTQVQFQALCDIYNAYEQSTILKLFNGDVFIEARNMDDKDKNFQIDTPFASIYLLTSGTFRINVDSEQRVEIYSFNGVAEVVGEYDSVLLRSGSMTFVTYRSNPADPQSFNSFYSDSFDHWNGERDDFYSSARRVDEYYDSAPYEIKRYYSELSYYGGWVYVPVYGYVWYPYGTYAGWRPYYDGYWHWGPNGYFWVSYEPWGWAPYHYGRWTWAPGYGWVWIPGRIFSGAWVAWSYGLSCIGWCPLDYWDRPAFININIYLGSYDFNTWNFIYYKDVSARNVRHAVLRQGLVEKDLRDAVVVRTSPRVRPSVLMENQDARRRLIAEARERKNERVSNTSRERTPASLPNFRDHEKDKVLKLHERMRERSLKPVDRTKAARKEGSGDVGIPSRREQSTIPLKDSLSERKGSSPMKSYPRRQEQDRMNERKETKSKDQYQRQEIDQKRDRTRQNEMKSLPRRINEDQYRPTYERKENQRTYKNDTSITEKQRSQRDYRQEPRTYNRQEQRKDSDYRLKKMLRDMSQSPRTKEIKKRETQPTREMKREAPKKKQDSKSSSSGESKKSSGSSRSDGKKSRGR